MTGDGIRKIALKDAIKACQKEQLRQAPTPEVDAYNNACHDCIYAIMDLLENRK
jgi:hypothetical protein